MNGRVKQPSLTSVVDTLTRLSPKAPAVGESANEDGVASLPLDPEKLAYILIGVCCGLSLLCLVSTTFSFLFLRLSLRFYRIWAIFGGFF